MNAINDGGSAYPQIDTRYEGECGEYTQYVESVGGMSLRDYFAAKALFAAVSRDMFINCETEHDCALEIMNAAVLSFRLADAMLKARES
jgi:hypothetical protein